MQNMRKFGCYLVMAGMILPGTMVFDTAKSAEGEECTPKVVVIPLISGNQAAGPVGDAVAADVLAGKTFSNDNATAVSGTMVDNLGVVITPGTTDQTIAEGYHDGTGYVAGNANLLSNNIKNGVTIFGTTGTLAIIDTSSGDAVAGDIRAGKKAWVDGGEVTGTIATRTLSSTTTSFSAGYYEAGNLTTIDADLTTDNIRSGATLFGVAGNSNVVDTSSGDAVAGEMLAGKKAWVDGGEVTGTLATQTLSPTTSSVSAGYYEATDLTTIDTDLTAGNIKSGAQLFGVSGTYVAAAPTVARAWGCALDGGTGVSAPWAEALCLTDCYEILSAAYCDQVCPSIGMYLDLDGHGVVARNSFCNTPM